MKFIITLILFISLAFAESVTLKSGKKISGFINFRSLEYIIIQEDSTSYVIPFKNIKEIEFNPNYLRIANQKLQTKVIVLEKDGKIFTFCSALHIGNRSYYRKMESILDKSELCIFEAFGVQYNEDFSKWQIPKKKYYDNVNEYYRHNPFHEVARVLGLEIQLEELNCEKYFWEPSDISQSEFNSLLKKRAIEDVFENMFSEVDPIEIQNDIDLEEILNKAVKYPNNKKLKKIALNALARDIILSENMPLTTYMKVVLIDRNTQLLSDIYECLQNKDLKTVSVVYGAYHMKDIILRLKKSGFIWIEEYFISAWDL